MTRSILLLQQVYYPVPLKWQILFLFIRKVTSSTATIIDPYFFFPTLVNDFFENIFLRTDFGENYAYSTNKFPEQK